jgi:hypothetical protein
MSIVQVEIKVAPFGIHGKDQANFPCPRPMLHVLFALDGGGNPVVKLVPDETGEPVPFREAFAEPFSMLVGAPG